MSEVAGESPKKRYPRAEEIVVIGGYQNLEKSCLIKKDSPHKRVKVCFDESQLERVCEYPSETSLLSSLVFPHDTDKEEARERTQEDEEEEAVEERGVFVTKGPRSVGAATGRVLRVDESCPR